MNVPNNLAKSCTLALVVFWIVIGSSNDANHDDLPVLILLSIIPIFVMVTIVVITSICTIFWASAKKDFSKYHIFKAYFPYYAIVVFTLCTIGIFASNFDIYMIAFFTSAFITTSQSWVWFAKDTIKQ